MGVFKNDVGRPSNKTIMIRNILKVIVVIILVSLAFCVGYLFKNNNSSQNKTNNKVSKNTEELNINSKEISKLTIPFSSHTHDANEEELYKADLVEVNDLSTEYKNRLAYFKLLHDKSYNDDILKSSDLEEYYYKLFGKNEKYIPKSFEHYSYDEKEDVYYADENVGDLSWYRYANKFYKALKNGNKIELYEYVVVYNENIDFDSDIHKVGVFSNINDADNYKNVLKEFDYEELDNEVAINDIENMNKYRYITNHYKLTFEKEDGNYVFKQIEKIKDKEVMENQKILDKYTIKNTEDKESQDYQEVLFEGKKIELGTNYRQRVEDVIINNKLVYITTSFYDDGNLYVMDNKGNIITVFIEKSGSNKKYNSIKLSGNYFSGNFIINDDNSITITSYEYVMVDYKDLVCGSKSNDIVKYEDTYKYSNGKFKRVDLKKYSAKEIIEKEYIICEN